MHKPPYVVNNIAEIKTVGFQQRSNGLHDYVVTREIQDEGDYCASENLGGMTLEDFRRAGIANLETIQRVSVAPGASYVFLGEEEIFGDSAEASIKGMHNEPR